MPITGYEGGDAADRKGRAVAALRKEAISVREVHRVWTEEDLDGVPFDVALYVSEDGTARTAQIWPTGDIAVEEGW